MKSLWVLKTLERRQSKMIQEEIAEMLRDLIEDTKYHK